ncbi:transposase [Deinococcus sp. Arct2-2]|nr:transposase [Deinococcus sp. Arct2-2]
MFKTPKWFCDVIAPFAEMFTCPTWSNAQTLLIGAILAPRKRTISALLSLLGLGEETGFAKFHRFLSQARWFPLQGSRILLNQLLANFVPSGPIFIGVDDTLERRHGRKIAARGIYRDPVRSSHGHFVKASGLRWLSLMLLAPIPQAGRVWALPFLTALVPSSRYAQTQGKRH